MSLYVRLSVAHSGEVTSTHLAPPTCLLPRKGKKCCTALTKSSKGAALPCPQEKQRGSCTALTEKQRVAALRPKNSDRDTSLRVLESYDPKPAPKGKNVRTSARLTRKVASKHRRAAQPHIVQLSRRKRKVRKRVTPELPCHAWLTTGDRNIAKWKAALKCLQWRHCRWRPPRRRGHRRCATRRSRA